MPPDQPDLSEDLSSSGANPSDGEGLKEGWLTCKVAAVEGKVSAFAVHMK